MHDASSGEVGVCVHGVRVPVRDSRDGGARKRQWLGPAASLRAGQLLRQPGPQPFLGRSKAADLLSALFPKLVLNVTSPQSSAKNQSCADSCRHAALGGAVSSLSLSEGKGVSNCEAARSKPS